MYAVKLRTNGNTNTKTLLFLSGLLSSANLSNGKACLRGNARFGEPQYHIGLTAIMHIRDFRSTANLHFNLSKSPKKARL